MSAHSSIIMLEQLFGSKTRVRLLRLFLANQNESYFVRELTRKIGAQINAVRNELDNLVSMGVVKAVEESELKSNGGGNPDRSTQQRKYFRINTDAVLYPELRALFSKSGVLLENEFVHKLGFAGKLQYLALMGYFVGDVGAPTDVFIVGNLNKDKVATAIRAFERAVSREINYTMMTPQEFRQRKDLTDRFLYGILESKKVVMADHLNHAVEAKAAKVNS